ASAGMTSLCFLLCLVSLSLFAQAPPRTLDNFDNLTPWTAQHTDDVSATLHSVDGKVGKAVRLQFDFTDAHGNPINGYATARRELPLQLPDNYELSFWIRGEAPGKSPSAKGRSPSAPDATDGREGSAKATDGRERPPVNTLQFKLVDASGENVWWLNRPDFTFPHEWRQIKVKKRQIEFAWGPIKDRTLRQSAAIEFVVSSGRDGGKGSIEIDELTIRELPTDTGVVPAPVAGASSSLDAPAQNAIEAGAGKSWCS